MRGYATQMEAAKKSIITPEMIIVAEKEKLTAEYIMQKVACGEVAIPCNKIIKIYLQKVLVVDLKLKSMSI